MPKRLFAAVLLAAILVGCAQGVAPTVQPAAPTDSDLAVSAAAQSAAPSVAPQATPTATPAPMPTPSPTPSPTPEPWQSFRSKKLHYSIKYPPNWVATPATPGYGDMLDDRGATVIYIDKDVVGAGSDADLARTAKSEIAYYKSHYDATVLSNKKVKVGSWKGRLVRMTGNEEGLETYFQLLLLAKGRTGYFVDWRSMDDNREADTALFERIYTSFKRRP